MVAVRTFAGCGIPVRQPHPRHPFQQPPARPCGQHDLLELSASRTPAADGRYLLRPYGISDPLLQPLLFPLLHRGYSDLGEPLLQIL